MRKSIFFVISDLSKRKSPFCILTLRLRERLKISALVDKYLKGKELMIAVMHVKLLQVGCSQEDS